MTEERIAYTVSVGGAEQAAQSFGKVGTSIDSAAKAGGSFNAKVSGASMLIADFGMAAGRSNPQIAQLTNVIMGARSSLMGLTAALGGPVGLAAGALAAGAIAGLEYFSRAQKEAAETTRLATEAIVRQQAALATLTADLAKAAGIAGPSESETLRARIISSGAKGSDRAQLKLLASMAEDREYAASNASELAKVNAAEASMGGGGGRRSGGSLGDSSNDFMSVAEQRRLLLKRSGGGKDDLDSFIGGQASGGDFELEEHARIEEEKTRIEEEQLEERTRLFEEHEGAAQKARKANMQMLVTTGAAGAAALGQQLAAISRGQKASAKAILATIGEAAVGTGTMGLLESALLATNPATIGFAPAHLAASLALIAGGMMLGAASSAGGGGKGGGASVGLSRPIPTANGSADTGGGVTYINIHAPSMVGDADSGVHIANALARSNAVHGTTVSRRVVEA